MKKSTTILGGLFVILLFVLYVTSYARNVDRSSKPASYRNVHLEEGERFPLLAAYRSGGRSAEIIYSPLLFLDRHIRPDYWNYIYHANPVSH
jgi:hypothetical protein